MLDSVSSIIITQVGAKFEVERTEYSWKLSRTRDGISLFCLLPVFGNGLHVPWYRSGWPTLTPLLLLRRTITSNTSFYFWYLQLHFDQFCGSSSPFLQVFNHQENCQQTGFIIILYANIVLGIATSINFLNVLGKYILTRCQICNQITKLVFFFII